MSCVNYIIEQKNNYLQSFLQTTTQKTFKCYKSIKEVLEKGDKFA